jgi:hypothetical protein
MAEITISIMNGEVKYTLFLFITKMFFSNNKKITKENHD